MSFLRACAGWLLILTALPALTCSESRLAARTGLDVRVEVVDDAGQATRSVAGDASVQLRIALTNHGPDAARLPFSSARTHDAVVVGADGEEVWRWSTGRMFAQMLIELELAPGESKTFQASCDPTRQGGRPLAPGRYDVVAIVPAIGAELQSEPVALLVE